MSDTARAQPTKRSRILALTLAITIPLVIVVTSLFVARWFLQGLGDRHIYFEGTLYEWVDAPAGSEGLIYVDESLDTNAILEGKDARPLDVTGTTFTTMYSSQGELIDFREIKTHAFARRPLGAFNLDDLGAMPPKLALKVERIGYKTLISELVKAGGQHSVVVLMVPDN